MGTPFGCPHFSMLALLSYLTVVKLLEDHELVTVPLTDWTRQ